MSVMLLPLAAEPAAKTSAPDPAPLLEELATLRRENAALRAQNVALQERIRDLDARLGQTSANSSRPPSSDPPQAPARPKGPPTGRKRGGQPGHRSVHRGLLPVEQVDEVVAVVPERCRQCGQPFPETGGRQRGRCGAIRSWSCCPWRYGSPSTRWQDVAARNVGSALARTCRWGCRGGRSARG